MKSNAKLWTKSRMGVGVGTVLVACAPLAWAGGLVFAAPATANPAMCAVDPSVYQTPGACQTTQKPVSSAAQSGNSALLHANQIDPATDENANSLPEVNGIPCTGLNTGQCIGLQLAMPNAG